MRAQTEEFEAGIGWWHLVDEEPSAERKTILFVEDEVFVREVTSEVLRSAGYRVLSVKDASEALRVYDQRCGEFDLLLTDVVLPGESGRVLAGKLRRQNPRLKILFVTGYADQMGLKEGEQTECLAKPFSTGVLLRTIKQLLDRGEFQSRTECLAMPACGNE